MSNQQENKIFQEDGIRPIQTGDIEIADTFEEDGTRPITKSPDFLVNDSESLSQDLDAQKNKSQSTQNSDSQEQNSTENNNSSVEVVDTFEEDGTRPIMANKYEVVDTYDIDGERPITSNNS